MDELSPLGLQSSGEAPLESRRATMESRGAGSCWTEQPQQTEYPLEIPLLHLTPCLHERLQRILHKRLEVNFSVDDPLVLPHTGRVPMVNSGCR